MTLDHCKTLTKQYADSFVYPFLEKGNLQLLANIKTTYTQLTPQQQEAYKQYILKEERGAIDPNVAKRHAEKALQGGIAGAVAFPAIDAYFNGPVSLVRSLIGCCCGLFAGANIVPILTTNRAEAESYTI